MLHARGLIVKTVTGPIVWLCFGLLLMSASCQHEQDEADAGKTGSQGAVRTDQKAPRHGGRLVIGLAQEPETLMEFLNGMDAVSFISNMIFSKFVHFDEKLALVPDLITEIPTRENGGVSEDYLTYTYHLRPDAVWQDGRPVTSGDVAFTFDLLMHPDVNTESREGLEVIEEMLTPDRHTVVVKLKTIRIDLTADLFFEEAILPRHLLAGKAGKDFARLPFQKAPVGSGPFILKEWIPASHIWLTANDKYYKGRPYLDEIIVKFIPDMNTMLIQLETGEIDGFQEAEISHVPRLKALPGIRIHTVNKLKYEHVDFNTEHPWLQDGRLRRAIALGVDRGQILDKVFKNLYEPAYADMPPISPYYNPASEERLRYHPDLARELLEEAGWHLGAEEAYRARDGRRLTLSISTTKEKPERELTQLVLVEQMKQLGIELKIKNYKSSVFFERLREGRFDLAMYYWTSAPDPSSLDGIYSSNFIPPKGQNHCRFRNERLDRLLDMGTRFVDFNRRKRIYDEVAVILAHEVPSVPLYWRVNLDPFTKRLQNYKPSPAMSGGSWDCNEWWLSESE
jgi:peptide/nickel transport system substrate-binding protein